MFSSLSVVNVKILTELLLPTGFIHLTRGLLSTTLPYFILTSLELSKTEVGLAVGAVGLGKVLCDVPAGILLDFLGATNLMILSGCIISSSSLLMLLVASTHSFALVVVAMLLAGAGEGLGVISRLSLVTENVSLETRGRVSALLGGSARLGSAFGPLLALMAISLTGTVRSVFVLQSLLALSSVVVVFLNKSVPKTNCENKKNISCRFPVIPLKSLSIIFLFMLALQILRECRKLIIPLAGVEAGYTLNSLSLFTTVSFTIDALLFSVAGVLMDEMGRNFSGVLSISLLTLSLVVIVPGTTLVALAAHAIISGLGNGFSAGLVVAFGADLAPPGESRSEFLGYFRLCADIGEFVGPLTVGLVAQYTSTPTMINIISSIGVLGMVWIIILGSDDFEKGNVISPDPSVFGKDSFQLEPVAICKE